MGRKRHKNKLRRTGKFRMITESNAKKSFKFCFATRSPEILYLAAQEYQQQN
jgi:hypothetical protein